MANFLIYTRIFSNVGREKGSNVKVPHLALQGVSTEFVLIETHREGNVPHVARNVWLSGFQMFVLFEVVINEPTFPLSHTLLATCGTLLFL